MIKSALAMGSWASDTGDETILVLQRKRSHAPEAVPSTGETEQGARDTDPRELCTAGYVKYICN